jgi:hypothetical protein
VPLEPSSSEAPESLVFDKAIAAESLEKLGEWNDRLGKELEELKAQAKDADGEEKEKLVARSEALEQRRSALAEAIAQREEKKDA